MGGCWRLGRGCRVAVRGGAPLKTPCGAAFRLQHRDSSRCPAVETSLDAADTSVRATGRFHDLWWDSQPMETPLRTRVGRAKGPAPQCSIAATKAGPTGASAADQGVRPTNRRRQRRNWWVVVQIIAGCEDFQAHAGSLTVAA